MKETEFVQWYAAQQQALVRGEEIMPPWVAFPNTEGWWGGWRQGNGEGWLLNIWLPFWQRLSATARIEYADRWNASDDWRDYILNIWANW